MRYKSWYPGIMAILSLEMVQSEATQKDDNAVNRRDNQRVSDEKDEFPSPSGEGDPPCQRSRFRNLSQEIL